LESNNYKYTTQLSSHACANPRTVSIAVPTQWKSSLHTYQFCYCKLPNSAILGVYM